MSHFDCTGYRNGRDNPPVGINVYVASGIAKDIPLEIMFKGALPFLVSIFATVFVLMVFPEIALILTNFMR